MVEKDEPIRHPTEQVEPDIVLMRGEDGLDVHWTVARNAV
jgi:hypothetical protein